MAYPPLAPSPRNAYCARSGVWDLMDASKAQHAADPATYPTKYTYFSQQLAQACINGTCSSGLYMVDISVRKLKNKLWPAQKTFADRFGLTLVQYEGGCHFVGGTYISGYGGDGKNIIGDRFTDFLVGSAHSSELASAYAASYQAWKDLGFKHAAKYVEGGAPGRYGSWGGMRCLKMAAHPNGDVDNPVWQAVVAANIAA